MESEGTTKGQDPSTHSKSEGYVADDETRPGGRNASQGEGGEKPTAMENIKEKFWEVENHMKGKEPSATEDPHPELAYIPPVPQEDKPVGFFSRMGHKLRGQSHDDATPPTTKGMQVAPEVQAANKGVGSSELGTGYEEDGEETSNPAES